MAFIKGFRSTNVLKAFLLNALTSATISVIIIELRLSLDEQYGWFHTIDNYWFSGGMAFMTKPQKMVVTFIIGFLASFTVYNFFYVLFNFGGGMLTRSMSEVKYL